MGVSLSRLQNTSFQTLFSSEATMQAQHHAKTKMDYLVFCGYNALVEQPKTAIEGSSFKDSVALGSVSTDSNGISRRTVTVKVFHEDETMPRATLEQVFYSNDANKYVTNGSSVTNSISMHYDAENDKLYAKVDGIEKPLGSSSGVPVGTIIAWPGSNAPTEGGTWLLCNGQSCATYPDLVAVVGNNVPNLNGRFLEGTTGTPRTFKEAGLPNIKGSISTSDPTIDHQFFSENIKHETFEGAFCNLSGTYSVRAFTGPDGYGCLAPKDVSFDASRSNSIYGASDTVQPASYTVRYFIKAA